MSRSVADLAAELNRGKALRAAGDHAGALAAFAAAVWADPAHLDARAETGFALLAAGRAAAAEAVFAAVLTLAPCHAPALAGMAQALRRRGDRAGALDCVQLALVGAPGHVGLLLEAGYDLLALGRVAAAEALFRRADAHAAPDDVRAKLALGHAARQAGARAAALAAFTAAAAAAPEASAPRVAMAEDLLALGRPAEAEAVLRGVLAADPDDLGALLGRSEIAWLAQDLAQCLALARQAMAAHPHAPAPLLQATRALMDLGRAAEALALLEPAGTALGWPDDLRARHAEILRRDGQWAAARAALAGGTAAHFGLFVQRVLLHLTIHELDEAARLLAGPPGQTAFERACAHHLRGQVAEAGWRLAEAAAHYRAAAATDAGLSWPHAELARLCLLQFDLDGCEHHQWRALQLDASAYMLRRNRRSVIGTHIGQIWDEMRADARLGAALRSCLARPDWARIDLLRALLREQPDTLAPSLLLLVALRQAGRLAAPPAAAGAAIPRVIVQFWDEAAPPADVAALMASWPAQHPDWRYARFDLASAGAWLLAELGPEVAGAYRRARLMAQKADIFRLGYLSVNGGVWADADDRCLAPLDPLLAGGVRLLGWQEAFGSVGNNLLAAAPGVAAVVRARRLAVAAVNRGDSDIPWLSTGPGALSRALAQEIAADPSALAGLRLLERGEAARLAVFHGFVGYKRTNKHWLKAAFAAAPERA